METTQSSKVDSRSTELARAMFRLRSEKQQFESKIKEIDSELDQVRDELTKIMTDLEVHKFAIDGLGTFYLSTNVYPKVLDADKLIDWLDHNGASNIAPRKVVLAAFKELVEDRLSKDQPVPAAELVDMTPETSVRLRIAKGA